MAKKSYEEEREERKAQITKLFSDIQKAKVRLATIKLLIPEAADTKERKALKDERIHLLDEIESLPEDIAETARLYALADLGHMAELHEQNEAAIAERSALVQSHEHETEWYSRTQHDNNERFSVSSQKAGHDDDARDRAMKEYQAVCRKLGEEWKPRKESIREDQKALNNALLQREVLRARLMTVYGVKEYHDILEVLTVPNAWPRIAHTFGEAIKDADYSEAKRILDRER